MERSANDKRTADADSDAGIPARPLPPFARDWALFLDIDGTLLEIADTPEQVRVSAGLRNLLVGLQPILNNAVALVTGRTVSAVDSLFGIPAMAVAGLHGLEWRSGAGEVLRLPGLPPVKALLGPLSDLVAQWPGTLLEDKGGTVAVHYRGAPDAAEAVCATVDSLLREHPELATLHGKMVVEVKPRRGGKGNAIARFMAAAPFQGRTPVFLGDDVTDEDGFATVNRLGGYSIRVGPNKPTQARYALHDVDAVNRWLETMYRTLSEAREDGE